VMSVEAAFPTPPSFYKRYAAWTEESTDEGSSPRHRFLLMRPLMIFGALAFPPANVAQLSTQRSHFH